MNAPILDGTKAWMAHMHQHPELALQETETAKFIAEKETSFGFEFVGGIGKNGIVAAMSLGRAKDRSGCVLISMHFRSNRSP